MDFVPRNRRMLLVMLMFASMAGCVPPATRPNVLIVPAAGSGQVVKVLDSVSGVLSLAPAAQAAAQASLAKQFNLTQLPEDRMRLALLGAFLPEPARQEDQAVKLLSGYNWEEVGPGFKGLAALVLDVLRTHQVSARNYQLLMQQLTAERVQRDHLQQQLDALKGIEKTMNKRDKPIVAPPASTTSPAPATPPRGG